MNGNVVPERKTGTGPSKPGGPSPFSSRNAQGRPVLPGTFPDGVGNTILFAEKYGVAFITPEAYANLGSGPDDAATPPTYTPGKAYEGGCYWAYFHSDCRIPFFAHYDLEPKKHPLTDPFAVGGKGTRPGFQVQPNPQGGCNPCLPATGHNAMNAAMADGSVRSLAGGMDRKVWWALVTPAGRDRGE
ncbi:MAG: hypothetical protein L0Y71_09615 [Gemmataceae bacterium]|nr:hypothetical protein [Gemmataceae bacterium]